MTLYLENGTGFKSVRLWNGQRLGKTFDADEQIYAPASLDDTVLSILSDEGRIEVDGITAGQQRIDAGKTGKSDPVDAVAEWVAELEAYVNSTQANEGYTLRNSYTNSTENVTPRAIGWSQNEGEYQSVNWNLTLEIGGDLGGDLGITPDSVSPGGVDTFDGLTLPGIVERRVDKTVSLDVTQELLSDTGENNVFQNGGAVKTITLVGQVEKTLSEMEAFDRQFRDRTGDGEAYTFESAFPGLAYDAAILSYESTREAGLTRRGEYVLELAAGSVT